MQLFISDLHLSGKRPETVKMFLRFLSEQAAKSTHLYILGDLFNVWIGDDDDHEPIPQIITALRQLSSAGTWLGVMHGNRDFLLGDDFCRATGAELLPDPSLRVLAGIPTLLMHGDLLCTDDTAYQAFRQQVRAPGFQQQFLALPLELRREKAAQYRTMSGQASSQKTEAIMDVNPQTVVETLKEHGAIQLIHGHTHRPADHQLDIDGQPALRRVLGDWQPEGSDILCLDETGFQRQQIRL
jgi:UDP-2,3-diacylglucosamine hydrolase